MTLTLMTNYLIGSTLTDNEYSDEYNLIVTLANDLEKLGYNTLTPQTLRNVAEAIEAHHIMQQGSFAEFSTVDDLNF